MIYFSSNRSCIFFAISLNDFLSIIDFDIESLRIYAGIHNKKYGLYRMFAKRFPYAVYYEIEQEVAYIVAILPMKRDPLWIKEQLVERG